MQRKTWFILGIILLAILMAYFVMSRISPAPQTPEGVAQCIGENSVLYVQLGCKYCEEQKNLFGASYKDLNVIDCWFKLEECSKANIKGTPTWIIDGKEYVGVQSIEYLQELTGCESP